MNNELSAFLAAYLPLDRRLALVEGRPLPERCRGSVLFADLSGFTPLMERLVGALGPQRGAEELTLLLNQVFGRLIETVHRYGGAIVAFGGDALTCCFLGERAGRRATEAGLAMQRVMAEIGTLETTAGPVQLSMHIGIGSGEMRRFLVGREPYGLVDLLAGKPVERMGQAQGYAQAGEVVVDRETAWEVPGEEVAEGYYRALPGTETTVGELPALPALPAEAVRRWLTEAVWRRIQSGGRAFAAELRLVTSVFVRFDGLDYEGDAEVGKKLDRYVGEVQQLLGRYEGHLGMVACGEKGSVVLGVLGAPLSHEDDVARAVGFAEELLERGKSLGYLQGQRVGISHGRVYAGVLGSERRWTYTVMGDEVNLSARLMGKAGLDTVLVSERVLEGAAGRWRFEALGQVAMKGKAQPVPVYLLRGKEERVERREGEREVVGREQEQERLQELLAQEGGRVLEVVGEAGVGKTALVEAVLEEVERAGRPVYVGRCVGYGQKTAYLPWRRVIEQMGGLRTERDREGQLRKVVRRLADPAGRVGYWEARFPLLAEAVGLRVEETPLTRALEGELRRDNTFQVLEAVLEQWGRGGVVVIEDGQWADELSRLLAVEMGRMVCRPAGVALLVVRREEDGEGWEGLSGLPGYERVALEALGAEAVEELARRRLGKRPGERLRTVLQERAQGNPFFVEELVRTLEEGGQLVERDDEVDLREEEAVQVPETVEGLVRARIDRLGEGERLTLKVAAVVGREFERGIVWAVHPERPAEGVMGRQLAHLEEAAFTQLEEGEPWWRYAFRQATLQEVAYETLLYAQRRALHGAIGAELEQRCRGDEWGVVEVLAYHYARSGEREKAIAYLRWAGDKARREYANKEALAYYTEALERLRKGEEELRYELLSGRERIYDLLGEREAQGRELDEMERLAQAMGDGHRQVEVLNRKARRLADMGAYEEGLILIRSSLDLARQVEDLEGLAEGYKAFGVLQASAGDYKGAEQAFRQALETYRHIGDREGEFTSLNNLGLLSDYCGNIDGSLNFYRQALEISAELNDPRWEARLLINLGLAYLRRSAYDLACLHGEQALEASREVGDQPAVVICLGALAEVAFLQGDLQRARTYHQEALDLAWSLQDAEGAALAQANLGLLALCRGDLEEAETWLHQAVNRYRQIGSRRGEALALHGLGQVAFWAGRPALARDLFAKALAIRTEIGEVGNDLLSRSWLGLTILLQGDPEEARRHLDAVLEGLARKGYGGDAPEQEIWWATYRIWQGLGEEEKARRSLERAYHLVQEQASFVSDPANRRTLLQQIPVNREIVRGWERLCGTDRSSPSIGPSSW